MPKFLTPIDLNKNELQNFRLQNLASDPSNPVEGLIYYNSGSRKAFLYNGITFLDLTGQGTVSSITTGDNIVVIGGTSTEPTISVSAVTTSTNGLMLYTDKTILDAATSANTASTLVKRDSSGGFCGDLTGNASTASKLATARTITVSGDASGSVTYDGSANSILTLTLGSSGVTAGTYPKVTVNDKGLVTGSSTLTATDIPTMDHYKISDFDAQVRLSTLNQMASPTADVSLNSHKITNLATPVSGTDAVTKDYADNLRAGITTKDPVKCATTAALSAYTATSTTLTASANGALTIDGYTVALNDRVLVKNETNSQYNGIYTLTQLGDSTHPWIFTRATDSDNSPSGEVVQGMATWVDGGTTNANSRWVLTTSGTITLGTTELTFTKDFQASDLVAGAGLTKTGNQLDIVGTANRITVNADNVDISSTYVGQTSITTLGTITAGTWNGTAIAIAYGGTGATTAADARTNLGLSTMSTQSSTSVTITGGAISGITDLAIADGGTGASTASGARSNLGATGKYAVDIGDGSSTAINVMHNLGSTDVIVQVKDKLSPANVVYPDIEFVDSNTVAILFATAPTSAQYHCVVIG